MTEWKTYKIGEIIDEIAMGPFGSNIKVDNFVDFGVPVLNGANLQGFKLKEESFNYVSSQKADSLGKANAYRGDIVITHRGTLGQIVYIPNDSKFERYIISQSQFRVRLNSQYVLPEYFVYYFHTRLGQHKLLMNASQVGVPALARPTSTFKDVTIDLPSLEEQRRIVGILGAIDDKIENNRRINTNLELQAQALYKQWFVDSSTVKLGDVVETTSGGTPSRSHMEFYVGKYGWVKSKELNSSFITKTEETITDDAIAKSAAKLLPAKSILIAMYGATVGQYAILSKPMTCNQAVCALLPNENYPYTYLFMVAKNIKEELANKAIGSAQQNISQVIIKDIDISSDIEKIKQFHKIVCPHFEVMEKNQKENETLATLRDTLLSKLMNGEIKIDE